MNRLVIAGATIALSCGVQAIAGAVVPISGQKTSFNPGREASLTKLRGYSALPAQPLVALVSPTNYAAGNSPSGIAVADFNGDGYPDVAVADTGSDNILLWLGRGDGTLSPPLTLGLAAGSQPSALITADFNGDGKTDLAVGINGALLVFLGNGDGTFQSPSSYSISYAGTLGPGQLVSADFNNDGIADVAFASPGGVGVLLGSGGGSFLAETDSASACPAGAMAAGDLNKDGRIDLAVAGSSTGSPVSVCLLLGNGNGTFSAGTAYSLAGTGAASIVLADFNNDGWLDFAVSQAGADAVTVQLSNGDGTYGPAANYGFTPGASPLVIGAGDLNADGLLDLFATNGLKGGISILAGNGDGTFQSSATFAAGGNSVSIALADLNGDGRPDLVVSNQADNTVSVLLNTSLAISASTLTFGQQAVGNAGASQTLTLTNIGNVAISFTSIGLTGANPGDFQNSNSCGATLGPGNSCTETIAFDPTSVGTRSANLTISDSAVGSPQVIGVSGNGVPVSTVTSVGSSVNPSVYGQSVILLASVSASSTVAPTGSVTFTDGNNILGTAALSAGTSLLSVATFTAGNHSITATYSGDANFNSSVTGPMTQTVNIASTATALASSVNPSYVGQAVTFTASVKSQYGGAVGGNVTFKQGTKILSSAAVSNGAASYSATYSIAGPVYLTATYSGDVNNAASTSPTLKQQVNSLPATSTTKVVTSGSPSMAQGSVTFTATITSTYGPIPDGEIVTFFDGTTSLGTASTAGGACALVTSALAAGTHTIKASYAGDATFKSSAGTVTQVVNLYATTVTFATAPNPSVYGQAVSLTATVASGAPGGPTGSVTFKYGSATLGTATLSSGSASLAVTTLPAGTLTLTANYSGDALSGKSTAKTTQSVNRVPTSTSVTSSVNPSNSGQLVTLTASVKSAGGTPLGSVTFLEGAIVLGTVNLSSGTASFASSTLLSGAQTITATYTGNPNFVGSSGWIVQSINDTQGGAPEPPFFAMAVSATNDMPKVSYGTLSHPPLAWTAIEGGGRGNFNFAGTDLFVHNAPKDANGVALIDLALGWTPSWAVADQTHCINEGKFLGCTIPPDNMQDWIDFVTALVNHYNGTTAPHIKYYEIWNEANNASFWTAGAVSLVSMAQAAYPILKQDPYSLVLTPSTVGTTGVSFMTSFLQGGGSNYADGVTFHGYTSTTGKGSKLPVPMPESLASTNAPIQTMITSFRQVADSNGMQGKPLMTTEGGWGVYGVTDPDQQAAWVAHYLIVQAGLASANNLQFQTWYSWGFGGSGVIETSQGLPSQAGYAYQQVYNWLLNSQPSPCSNVGNIWSCAVSSNLIVWDSSQTCGSGICTSSSYAPPAGYSRYMDLTGTVLPINGPISLGVKPIMLEP